jgi:hypothetical protein
VLLHKAIYLNTGFFLIRALVSAAGSRSRGRSRACRGGRTKATCVNLTIRMSGGGIVFYAFGDLRGDRLDHVD